MAEIIQINHERPIDFVRRRGTVSTIEVAHRFGWTTGRAYLEMAKLHQAGEVTGELALIESDGHGGTVKVWRAVVPCLT